MSYLLTFQGIKNLPLGYEFSDGGLGPTGSKFAGVITQPDGQHVAVLVLKERPEKLLNWGEAMAWAKSVGGVLPSRSEFAMAFVNVRKDIATEGWFWTRDDVIDPDDPDDEDFASYACYQDFNYGGQHNYHESYEGRAVAVLLVPLL